VLERAEHLEQCKARARLYLERGALADAVTVMLSELNQHPETRHAGESMITAVGLLYVKNNDSAGVRRFIEGFR
jgi:hypothetical protein